MLDKYDAKYGGTGIVMDVNSGAILAMASYPNYDPSDYSTIYSDQLQELLDAELAEIQQNRSSAVVYQQEEPNLFSRLLTSLNHGIYAVIEYFE